MCAAIPVIPLITVSISTIFGGVWSMNVVRYPIVYLQGMRVAPKHIRLPSGQERLSERLACSVHLPFAFVRRVDAVLEVRLRLVCARLLLLQ